MCSLVAEKRGDARRGGGCEMEREREGREMMRLIDRSDHIISSLNM